MISYEQLDQFRVRALWSASYDCKDVVSQISAVRSAADKAIAYIVAVNLEQCILEEMEAGRDSSKMVKQAVELLVKSR